MTKTQNEHRSHFTVPAVVGTYVTGYTVGPWYRTEWGGIYQGCRFDEEEGCDYHFFTDGICGTTPQPNFGIPAANFPVVTAVTIPFDACICDGKVAKPRANCWATTHNLKAAK